MNSTDPLSKEARDILKLNAANAYTKLVVTDPGDADAHQQLKSLTAQNVLSKPAKNSDEATALLAGLWLWHDCLDESHTVSQSVHTPSGSWWHAIMHRREGDFSNSKYWYARCESHPALQTLAAHAGDVINPFPADKRVLRMTANGWNPNAFVDLVEEVRADPTIQLHKLAVALQQLEWRTLFDHCIRAAV